MAENKFGALQGAPIDSSLSSAAQTPKVDAVRENNRKLHKQNQALLAKNKDLATRIQELEPFAETRDQIAELNARLTELQLENAGIKLLSEQLERAEQQLSEVESENVQLRVENQQLLTKAEQSRTQLQHAEAKVASFEVEADRSRAVEAEIRQRLQETSRALESSSDRLRVLEEGASIWTDHRAPDFDSFGNLLKAKSQRGSPGFRRLMGACIDQHDSWRKVQKARESSEELSVNIADLLVLFDSSRPVSESDVDDNEVVEALRIIAGLELIRRNLLAFLRSGGIEAISPIPGVTKFDSALHEDLPAHRRPTTRKELDGLVAQRIAMGVLEKGESSHANVLRKAQVGRYVLNTGGMLEAN